jgi:hypothetical protein
MYENNYTLALSHTRSLVNNIKTYFIKNVASQVRRLHLSPLLPS